MSLENLKMIHHLKFSFNKLLGEVPKGVFQKIGTIMFMENSSFCGPWINLSPCFVYKYKSVWHIKRVIIPTNGFSDAMERSSLQQMDLVMPTC